MVRTRFGAGKGCPEYNKIPPAVLQRAMRPRERCCSHSKSVSLLLLTIYIKKNILIGIATIVLSLRPSPPFIAGSPMG